MIIKKSAKMSGMMVLGVGVFPLSNISADALESTPEGQALDVAKTLNSYYSELYSSTAKVKPDKELSALSSTQSVVDSASNVLHSIPRNPITPYTNSIAVSSSWVLAYNKYINATTYAEKTASKNLLMAIADTEGNRNTFNASGLDTQTKYDPSNLPPDMLKKLNVFFTQLLNSLHDATGTNRTVYVNMNALSFAESVASGYEKDNYVAETGHNLSVINSAAVEHQLKSNSIANMYENLTQAFVTSLEPLRVTEAQLYKMVFDSTLNFTIYDVYSNFAHTESLLSTNTLGFDFSVVKKDSWGYVQMHVESVPNSNYLQNPNDYESHYGILADSTQKNAPQADAQFAYNTGLINLSIANSAYSSAMSSLSYQLGELGRLSSNAVMTLSSAQKAYDSVVAANSSSSSGSSSSSNSSNSSSSSSGEVRTKPSKPITARLIIKARIIIGG